MLGNDSVQIATTSRASARARVDTTTRQSVASETPRGVSASGPEEGIGIGAAWEIFRLAKP
jgi:hypothetical protein